MRRIRPYYKELDQLYQTLFGRRIDHSGYFTYASLLESGEKSLAEVEIILKHSTEFRRRESSFKTNA